MIWLAVLLSLVFFIILMMPFFYGSSEPLVSSSAINSPSSLELIKANIVDRYIKDEEAFKNHEMSATEWQKRKTYLLHRYMDAARRLDFLHGLEKARS